MKKFFLSFVVLSFSLFLPGCSNGEDLIPYDHMPEELSVAFTADVTPEEAMIFAKEYGAEIVEDRYTENGMTMVAPWSYWGQADFNLVRMRFSGADDERLLELIDELSGEDSVEFARIVRIVTDVVF